MAGMGTRLSGSAAQCSPWFGLFIFLSLLLETNIFSCQDIRLIETRLTENWVKFFFFFFFAVPNVHTEKLPYCPHSSECRF
jgi:hypothetical protein